MLDLTLVGIKDLKVGAELGHATRKTYCVSVDKH